jgi:hypothetical protein
MQVIIDKAQPNIVNSPGLVSKEKSAPKTARLVPKTSDKLTTLFYFLFGSSISVFSYAIFRVF